jgi:hypothetical protein
MMRKMLLPGLLLGLFLAGGVAAGGVDMQDGQWEITTTIDMPGMPMRMPPMTMTQCITQQDLIPPNEQPDSECEVTSNQINGNTVTWSIVCSGEGGNTRGDGQITYHGDRFEGSMKMSMPEGMTMTNRMSGRRIGPCK